MSTVTIQVTGMTCGHCENAVKTTLSAMDGVAEASASASAGEAKVTFDPTKTNPEVLSAAIENLGYDAIGWK